MKKVRVTATILAMAFLSLSAMSCKDDKKDNSDETMHTEINHGEMNHEDGMDHDDMNASNDIKDSNVQTSDAKQVMTDYMTLKNALVATNKEDAAKAGKKLEGTLNGFNASIYTAEQQKELKDIITDAKEHAEHIGKSEMENQRKHFKMLSKDLMVMVTITGTETTLYQQFCPMYDGGGTWLSMEKEIKNPYFGSKMMACGKVQKEIN